MYAVCTLLQTEVDAARRYICSLISRRNTLAPISVLPPELLVHTFHFHALKEPARSSGLPRLGWIVVTHVYERWHQVALHNSSLWAHGFSSHSEALGLRAEWIAKMLIRAQNAPLVVDFVGTESPEIPAMFPRHIFHTREHRLRGLSLLHSQSVQEICGSEAPKLENF